MPSYHKRLSEPAWGLYAGRLLMGTVRAPDKQTAKKRFGKLTIRKVAK